MAPVGVDTSLDEAVILHMILDHDDDHKSWTRDEDEDMHLLHSIYYPNCDEELNYYMSQLRITDDITREDLIGIITSDQKHIDARDDLIRRQGHILTNLRSLLQGRREDDLITLSPKELRTILAGKKE